MERNGGVVVSDNGAAKPQNGESLTIVFMDEVNLLTTIWVKDSQKWRILLMVVVWNINNDNNLVVSS